MRHANCERVRQALERQGPSKRGELMQATGLQRYPLRAALTHMQRLQEVRHTGEPGEFVFYLPGQAPANATDVGDAWPKPPSSVWDLARRCAP